MGSVTRLIDGWLLFEVKLSSSLLQELHCHLLS